MTVLAADYGLLQDVYGGPNHSILGPDARHRIDIDNSRWNPLIVSRASGSIRAHRGGFPGADLRRRDA